MILCNGSEAEGVADIMMRKNSIEEFAGSLSSAKPVPGGGGACAAAGAFAAALGMMVANLTVGKKRYADVEEEMKEILIRLGALRDQLLELIDKDAEAFEPLSRAYGLPRETPDQREEKERVLEAALYEASMVPLEIMERILEAMEDLEILSKKGSRIVISDAGVGVLFAQAALDGASLNVFINTKLMKNYERAQELNQKAEALIQEGTKFQEGIYQEVCAKIR